MDAQEWLDVVRGEYLDDFVRDGGAAVKFVVPSTELGRQQVREALRDAAAAYDYLFAFADAETTKIHLVDKLFHEIARQIPWDDLARAFLSRSLREMGFTVPPADESLSLSALAARNDYPEPLLHTEIRRGIWNQLYRDYTMTREFRLAMIQLCMAQLDPAGEATLTEAIRQWLTGDLRLISALKRALIFQKIARHNARHMLVSLAHWLRLAGRSGLVLGLDVARYADATRPSERGSGFYYSTAAAMDAYEVLRQLIDATDDTAYCFVGVVAGPEFLNDDRRGLRSYHALYLRVADEVRDRYRPNPRSALVRVGPGPGPEPAREEAAA
jgi:hypothetical protein